MLDVQKVEELEIPEGIEVNIKSRLITVKGPRGTLTKNVRHVNMDIRVIKTKTTKVLLTVWAGSRKHVACLRTIRTLINNMITGVTKVSGISAPTLSYLLIACVSGLPIQNACRLCPFPYQLHHPGGWHSC
jgi:hypothetical protein